MQNIELFNQACAIIFKKLYEEFPVPADFYQDQLGFYRKTDISEEANNRRRILKATFEFLRDEGYIVFKFQHEADNHVFDARLTSKGLSRLQIPDGLKESKKPVIDQIIEALKASGDMATSTALKEAIKHAIGLILGG